jgi:hypothetical protein
LITKLLETGAAVWANAIGVNHASDCSQIAFLKFPHFAPDFDNASYDFMTRNAWVDRPTPFVTDNMQIGMTDPAEKNLDLHIARLRIAAVEGEWF